MNFMRNSVRRKTIKYFPRDALRYAPRIMKHTYGLASATNTQPFNPTTTLAENCLHRLLSSAAWTFGKTIFHVGDIGATATHTRLPAPFAARAYV